MDTRERLVEAMQDLLWERGYVGTSPRAVQERAGAGQGSMYHHFRGKADLAAAALERTARDLGGRTEEVLTGAGSPLERLTLNLTRERDVLRGCRVGRMTQDPEVVADDKLRAPVDEAFRWVRRMYADVLAEAVAAGELPDTIDPQQVAATLVAVVQGGYVLARASGNPADFALAVDGALSLLRGLAA
ncbi:TetR/AcrR family transcriptional regulator [Motilibacter deserti]|uniref:TetR/AcrR family transcriptional regulator n=1 Tax=Motilibacter deserti TaxID=2714956 RepID=UPI002F2B42FC